MSLIVGIKDQDRIVLGSDRQASTGANKSHDATKIWEIPELPGAIMGGVGSMRASQALQYAQLLDKNDIPENIDTGFVVNVLTASIVAVLTSCGISCKVKDEDDNSLLLPNAFIFAYQDRAWMIWNDLSVAEVTNYMAIGSGSDVANGALFATKDKNPFERIVIAIDAAAETTLFVDNDIDFLATEYYEEDNDLVTEALGFEIESEEFKEAPRQEEKVTKKETTKKSSKGDK